MKATTILISFLLPSLCIASVSGESYSRGAFGSQVWGGKSDTEMKSTLDKKNRTDGYELATETNLYRLVGNSWGPLAGLIWKREKHENLDFGAPQPAAGKKKKTALPAPQFTSRNYVDSYYAGLRSAFTLADQRIQGDLSYNRLGELEDSQRTGYDAFMLLDLKSKASLSSRMRLKYRLKYWEFMRTRGDFGTDTRQLRAELSPSLGYGNFGFGLQNRITHRLKVGTGRYYVDSAPFLKYDRRPLELTLRTIFTPFVSADNRTFAENWQKQPVFSAEIDITL